MRLLQSLTQYAALAQRRAYSSSAQLAQLLSTEIDAEQKQFQETHGTATPVQSIG